MHARSALSLVLCRAALRLLSHPLLLPGRTSSQSGAVTHFSDSDCLDETTVVLPPHPPHPRLHGVAAAAPACARPVNYQQQRRHCRWSHRSPRLFLSPPQLRHCSPDSCILCLVVPPTQPHPRLNACANHSAFLLLCGALRPGLPRVLDFSPLPTDSPSCLWAIFSPGSSKYSSACSQTDHRGSRRCSSLTPVRRSWDWNRFVLTHCHLGTAVLEP